MTVEEIRREVLDRLRYLSIEDQERILAYADSLVAVAPKGVPGKALLKFAGVIDEDSAREMEEAIEEGCEKVDPDGW